MTKFKWAGSSSGLLTSGKTYEFDMSNSEHGEFIDDSGHTHKWTKERMIPSGWVPVDSSSPIRTRREIVPGVYGRVFINSHDPDANTVWVNVKEDFGCVEFNADQLREAAHLFNQIAEVLEENAG